MKTINNNMYLSMLKKKIRRRVRSELNLYKVEAEPLLTQSDKSPSIHLGHIGLIQKKGNAGDTLLPVAIKDFFGSQLPRNITWHNRHPYNRVHNSSVSSFNKLGALIIGGGGLFLKDTFPNNLSGWQWVCPIKQLKKITTPLIIYSVGYNRFKGQEDFDPVFPEHLKVLVEKSIFFGLRNYGSIQQIKTYLPQSLHAKIEFQPCLTTLLNKIYPANFFENPASSQKVIGLNCAFDRSEMRFAGKKEQTLKNLAEAFKLISTEVKIKYMAHLKSDLEVLSYFNEIGVPYETIRLFEMPAEQIIREYSKLHLAVGMRGHAQMIPFGCGTPILSIISHPKMRYFLDDIGRKEWGIPVEDITAPEKLENKILEALSNFDALREQIGASQDNLWNITNKNMMKIKSQLSLST